MSFRAVFIPFHGDATEIARSGTERQCIADAWDWLSSRGIGYAWGGDSTVLDCYGVGRVIVVEDTRPDENRIPMSILSHGAGPLPPPTEL